MSFYSGAIINHMHAYMALVEKTEMNGFGLWQNIHKNEDLYSDHVLEGQANRIITCS